MDSAVQCAIQQYSAVRYSGVHCSAVQCSSVQCSTGQCSAVECSRVQCSAVQCSAVQGSAVQYSTVQCSSVQYRIGLGGCAGGGALSGASVLRGRREETSGGAGQPHSIRGWGCINVRELEEGKSEPRIIYLII